MTDATAWTREEFYLVAETAYELHAQGKNADALTIIRGLLAIDPTSIYCLDAAAALLLAIRQPEAALAYASRTLSLSPYYANAIARRCEANIQLRRFQDMQADLDLLKHINMKALYRRIQMRFAVALRASLSQSNSENLGQLHAITD
jgi:hypothetical protein